jgi:hypothetical protein
VASGDQPLCRTHIDRGRCVVDRLPIHVLTHVAMSVAAGSDARQVALTLSAMAAVSKDFNSALDDEVWEAAWKNVCSSDEASRLERHTGDMTSRAKVLLVAGVGCQVCKAPRIRKVYWPIPVRCCKDCFMDNTVNHFFLQGDLGLESEQYRHLKAYAHQGFNPRARGGNRSYTMYCFWRDDVDALMVQLHNRTVSGFVRDRVEMNKALVRRLEPEADDALVEAVVASVGSVVLSETAAWTKIRQHYVVVNNRNGIALHAALKPLGLVSMVARAVKHTPPRRLATEMEIEAAVEAVRVSLRETYASNRRLFEALDPIPFSMGTLLAAGGPTLLDVNGAKSVVKRLKDDRSTRNDRAARKAIGASDATRLPPLPENRDLSVDDLRTWAANVTAVRGRSAAPLRVIAAPFDRVMDADEMEAAVGKLQDRFVVHAAMHETLAKLRAPFDGRFIDEDICDVSDRDTCVALANTMAARGRCPFRTCLAWQRKSPNVVEACHDRGVCFCPDVAPLKYREHDESAFARITKHGASVMVDDWMTTWSRGLCPFCVRGCDAKAATRVFELNGLISHVRDRHHTSLCDHYIQLG